MQRQTQRYSPKNCVDVKSESRANPILIVPDGDATTTGSARTLGIGSARTSAECLDILERASTSPCRCLATLCSLSCFGQSRFGLSTTPPAVGPPYNGPLVTLPGRFVALAPSDRWLLLQAGVLLAAVRALLRIVGLTSNRWLFAALIALARRSRICSRPQNPARVAWAVAAVSRRVGVTCLGQALVTQTMLELRSWSAIVRIGVRRGAAGEFESHAWVECAGSILPGQPAAGAYAPLLAFHRMRP